MLSPVWYMKENGKVACYLFDASENLSVLKQQHISQALFSDSQVRRRSQIDKRGSLCSSGETFSFFKILMREREREKDFERHENLHVMWFERLRALCAGQLSLQTTTTCCNSFHTNLHTNAFYLLQLEFIYSGEYYQFPLVSSLGSLGFNSSSNLKSISLLNLCPKEKNRLIRTLPRKFSSSRHKFNDHHRCQQQH